MRRWMVTALWNLENQKRDRSCIRDCVHGGINTPCRCVDLPVDLELLFSQWLSRGMNMDGSRSVWGGHPHHMGYTVTPRTGCKCNPLACLASSEIGQSGDSFPVKEVFIFIFMVSEVFEVSGCQTVHLVEWRVDIGGVRDYLRIRGQAIINDQRKLSSSP